MRGFATFSNRGETDELSASQTLRWEDGDLSYRITSYVANHLRNRRGLIVISVKTNDDPVEEFEEAD